LEIIQRALQYAHSLLLQFSADTIRLGNTKDWQTEAELRGERCLYSLRRSGWYSTSKQWFQVNHNQWRNSEV